MSDITFVGSGNMAQAIIGGLISNGTPAAQISASSPSILSHDHPLAKLGVQRIQSNVEAIRNAQVVVLAVKPQMMAQVCLELTQSDVDLGNKLFVSIAAGITVARLQEMLAGNYPLVRTMPNTPSKLQQGMTGMFASDQVSSAQRQQSQDIMAAVGKVLWLESESQMNHVIAAAGSAPAYFFLFMEAMQDCAQTLGFSPQQARMLVQQAALGSAQLVDASPDLDLATLRANVTSKGGTTAEAIAVFEQQQLRQTVHDAMLAAVKRAQDLETQL
ncbi:pyrroline-5-carboxylate reductase [Alginatibacterium sediminis]|uniref:Pyrroline-5-carboxylate reductase n=1 Tax=Alginatibacterium sediminis TaxID=2164068 RepID=A0A420E8H3_9ALTE|nr:pyrroline-5-carboxylate reductase [Alginatibacterium sediminis]RKF15667.1 pyrroline-5-carboxylate reductase [Alginatibacterium sediminis]